MSNDFILAFDYGGTKIAVCTATTSGELIERMTLGTVEQGGARAVVEAGIRAGCELIDKTSQLRHGGKLVSIGVSTMGVTYPDKVILAPNVPGWSELRMAEIFSNSFPGVPVSFENDVKCAALVELRKGELRDTDYGIYVNLGTGIMVVLTYGQQIMRGHHGASGEIAYNLLHSHDEVGFSHGAAPLEEVVGGRFIGDRGSAHFGRRLTAADLFSMAREGNAAAQTFLKDTLTELAYHLANLANVWNPQKIVFGAGMVASHDIIFSFINDYFQRYVPFPPQLAVARFNRDAGLFGAIELGLESLRTNDLKIEKFL